MHEMAATHACDGRSHYDGRSPWVADTHPGTLMRKMRETNSAPLPSPSSAPRARTCTRGAAAAVRAAVVVVVAAVGLRARAAPTPARGRPQARRPRAGSCARGWSLSVREITIGPRLWVRCMAGQLDLKPPPLHLARLSRSVALGWPDFGVVMLQREGGMSLPIECSGE